MDTEDHSLLLDVADRVIYKLSVIVHRCQRGKAPRYLTVTHR